MLDQKYLDISMMQVYYFIEVASCGSFTNAAHSLYTTQSTLSKNISSLERVLDVQLFTRTHNQLSLTEAGQYLYRQWQKMLINLEKDVEECRILRGGHIDTLNIGVLNSHNLEKTSGPLLRQYKERYPHENISIISSQAQEIRRDLIQGNLDAAFTVLYDVEQLHSKEFSYTTIKACNHSVCMLPENPLCEKEFLEVSDLKNSRFVGISPMHTPSYCGMIEDLCKEYGFTPHFVRFTANALSLASNLTDRDDIFICDKNYRDYQNPALQYLQFRPLIHTSSGVALLWLTANKKTPLLTFIDYIKEHSD